MQWLPSWYPRSETLSLLVIPNLCARDRSRSMISGLHRLLRIWIDPLCNDYNHCALDLKRFTFSWFPASVVTIGINPLLQVTMYCSVSESFHLAMSPSLVLTIWIFVVCLEMIRFTINDCTSQLLEFIYLFILLFQSAKWGKSWIYLLFLPAITAS